MLCTHGTRAGGRAAQENACAHCRARADPGTTCAPRHSPDSTDIEEDEDEVCLCVRWCAGACVCARLLARRRVGGQRPPRQRCGAAGERQQPTVEHRTREMRWEREGEAPARARSNTRVRVGGVASEWQAQGPGLLDDDGEGEGERSVEFVNRRGMYTSASICTCARACTCTCTCTCIYVIVG